MSNYESEHGQWTLPAAEFAGFRKAMQQVQHEHEQRVFDLTQEAWKSMTRRDQADVDAYRAAVSRFVEDRHRRGGLDPDAALALEAAEDRLVRQVVDRWERDPERPDNRFATRRVAVEKPTRVKKSDIDWPTNRTTSFGIGYDGTVSFRPETRTVSWDVGESNHAVEHAHDSPLAQAFFARLEQVRWTHGTGGYTRYSSEYDEDEFGGRAGSNINAGWGYLGIEHAPAETADFQNAKGEWITADARWSRDGRLVGKPVKTTPPARYGSGLGRVGRGVPAGGQFASRYRGDSGVRL